jgi:cardiolipin synthase
VIGLVWFGLALLIRAFRVKRRVRLRRRKMAIRRRLSKIKEETAPAGK